MNLPIKVLIVDDSALVRQMMQEMLSSDPNIKVVGAAIDPYDAREKIKQLHPDVLTLDVEMPKMDGVTFLKNLMRLHPLPVVMVSTLTEKGADVTFEALDLGAVDFVTKPKINLVNTFDDYRLEICRKVKNASTVSRSMLGQQYQRYVANQNSKPRVASFSTPQSSAGQQTKTASATASSSGSFNNKHFRTTDKIIALGASTGGTEAIKEVLIRLPANSPGMVITQHIPAAFSEPFAKRMDSLSEMTVFHAKDGQPILPGHVYIAPGDKHLEVKRDGARYICRLSDSDPVNRHKPSVEVMYQSVLENVGPNAIAVMLTGMGADGAKGMLSLKGIGVPTIAQNEATSVVWGMPGECVKIGAADDVLPLDKIPERILQLASK